MGSDDSAATLQAVAHEAALSVATVSKILSGKYKGNTPKGRERTLRVLAIAQAMGFIANASARRLRSGTHNAIIVFMMVDEHGHPPLFSVDFLLGINQSLRAQGKSVIVHTVLRPLQHEIGQPSLERSRQMPADRNFDGALVIDHVIPEVERFLAQTGVPVMYINVEAAAGAMSCVRDERKAGSDLIHALAEQGYRRIVTLGEIGGGHTSYVHRWAGISAAAQVCGLQLDSFPDPWWKWTMPATLRNILVERNTVVVAMDVHSVLMFVRHGPRDVALACCDDSHLILEIYPNLTRMMFDRVGLGRQAADYLLARMADSHASGSPPAMRAPLYMGSSTPPCSMG